MNYEEYRRFYEEMRRTLKHNDECYRMMMAAERCPLCKALVTAAGHECVWVASFLEEHRGP